MKKFAKIAINMKIFFIEFVKQKQFIKEGISIAKSLMNSYKSSQS